MKKYFLLLAGMLIAWNASAQFDDYFRGMSKEQKRSMGLAVADTLLIWPNGTPSPYETGGDPVAEFFSTALLEAYPVEGASTAVIVCPGGAYMTEAQTYEGRDMAGWFNARGISFYMLQYRLPLGKYTTAPLEDAQEAIRIVRKNGAEKVGIIGCSAGGHLASTAATHYTPDSRPDFQILFYPVITMDATYTHQGSRDNLLGIDPPRDLVDLYSNEKQVTRDTPLAFIMGSTDDGAVPVLNFINYYLALQEHGVTATMHLYPSGGHGWGFKDSYIFKQQWTAELDAWLKLYVL